MDAQQKATKLSKEIKTLRRRLEGANCDEMVKELQNDLTTKQGTIDELESEIRAIKKVTKHQEKALDGLNKEGVSDSYVDKVKSMVINNKNELKKQNEEYKREDKTLKAQHKMMVEMEEKCRMMERLVKGSKATKKQASTIDDSEKDEMVDDEIERLQREIEEIEQRENAELEHRRKILESIQSKKQELSHNVNLTELKIKEK